MSFIKGVLSLKQMIDKATKIKGKALTKTEKKTVTDKYYKVKKDNKNIGKRQKKQTKTPVANPRMMKKDYEVDIGKAPKDNVREIAQRKVRGKSGKAADKGSDPVVVGRKSMPSMADINAKSGKARAALVNKLDKMAKAGNNIAAARLKKLDAKSEADEATRIRKASQRKQKKEDISLAGQPKKEKVKTSDVIIGDKKNGINYETGEIYGNPTPPQMAQFERHIKAKMRTKGFGRTSPEFNKIMSALKKLKYPAAKELVKMLKKTYFTSKTMNKGKK